MASIASFDDVRRLDEPALRELLARGRPEERVWAIWALALRATPARELASREEPDPGVRRNLAVVLAGHGELDLLLALATRDPAPEVRGAALQLVARLAIDGVLPPELVVERTRADASDVKIAVLGVLSERAPRWLVELARRLLDDTDPDVRYEAFEALVRAHDHTHAMMWLEELPDGEARLALLRWSARRVRAVSELIAGSSRRLRRLLVESVERASWHDLAPAIGEEPGLLRVLARHQPRAFAEAPLEILLSATLREPSEAWLLLVRDRIAAREVPGELAPLLHDYRALCAREIAELDRRIVEVRGSRDVHEEDLDALYDARAALEDAYHAASRLLVH